MPEAYDLIREGLEWLGVKWNQEIYKSDRISEFYKYCEQLIKKGEAYTDLCEATEWREKIQKNREILPSP